MALRRAGFAAQAFFFYLLFPALGLGQVVQRATPVPLPSGSVPLTPLPSQALGSLEGLGGSLGTLPSLEPLGQAFDGLRPLPGLAAPGPVAELRASGAAEPLSRAPGALLRPLTAISDGPPVPGSSGYSDVAGEGARPQEWGGPPLPEAREVPFNDTSLPAYSFSPQGRIGDLLVRGIDHVQGTLDVAIHGLSIPEVAEALVRAKRDRKVKVRILVNEEHMFPERGRERSKELQRLLDEGFEMKILRGTGKYGVMHQKVAVFDGKVAVHGSFNWSKTANEVNFENIQFTDEAEVVSGYRDGFEWMWKLGKPVEGYVSSLPEFGAAPPSDPNPSVPFHGEKFRRYAFSPNGGIEAEIVKAVALSRRTIDVSMFAFFSQPIAEALVEARDKRKVAVRIVVDLSQGRTSPVVRYLMEQGFEVRFSRGRVDKQGVMHNKYAIFDAELLESGSFNWSNNAEKHNFENANFTAHPADLAAYRAYFEGIHAQATPLGLKDLDERAFRSLEDW